MAVITQTQQALTSVGAVTLVRNTLTSSDTLTWVRGGGQVLIVRNATAGALTLNLVGTSPSVSQNIYGIGGTVTGVGGKSLALAVGADLFIKLDDLALYLTEGANQVTVSGGTGATAVLIMLKG